MCSGQGRHDEAGWPPLRGGGEAALLFAAVTGAGMALAGRDTGRKRGIVGAHAPLMIDMMKRTQRQLTPGQGPALRRRRT